MIENRGEEMKNQTNPNGTTENDYNENDLLSSKANIEKSKSENLNAKIYSNKEVFEMEINQEFKGKLYFLNDKDANINNNNGNNDKIVFNMNSQELFCWIMRMIIFFLGISLILIVISKILLKEKN